MNPIPLAQRTLQIIFCRVLVPALGTLGLFGCTPVNVAPQNTSADSTQNDSTAEQGSPSMNSSSALDQVARNLAIQTTTSVASGSPISIYPNVVPETPWYDLVNHITPPTPGGAGGASGGDGSPDPNSGGGNNGQPANRPGQYKGYLTATVFEEILSTDPNLPHGQSITHPDSVHVVVSVVDGSVVDYTIPGFALNNDIQVAVTGQGETATASGAMDLDSSPNTFTLVVTTAAIAIADQSLSLSVGFTLIGQGGALHLDGDGTQTVTLSWDSAHMQYSSFTEYFVDMSASAEGQPNVLVRAHQTFTLKGTLSD